MTSFAEVAERLMEGDLAGVTAAVESLLAAGTSPLDIINQGLVEGMSQVGELFKVGEMFVPEVLMCARVMSAATDLLKPLLKEGESPQRGKVVICTVKGDQHDIGKNLVGLLLDSNGFSVYDLGTDQGPDKVLAAIAEQRPQIVGLSAMLTTTMPEMAKIIKAMEEAGVRQDVKVIIGGAPVTAEYAVQIGADGYSADAAEAVDLCRRLLNC